MKKSCIYILSAFLVLGIFTGCQNFLNGSVLKKELDEKIAYANATKVTFEMRVDNASYGTIYPASATVIKGESFEVSFTQQINALTVNWIVVDKSNSPVNNAVSYSEVLQQQEDGSVSHKLKVTATSDSVANLILKPVFTFDMPETAVPVFNSVSLYGDKDGKRRMSELHPDVWSAEGNGINNTTETPAIAYTKYKDTPWYKNCVSELYLSMNFSMAESDVKEIKVTETFVRSTENAIFENPTSCIQLISGNNAVSDGKGNYSISLYPLQFVSNSEGMFEYKFSVINSYGLETMSDTVIYVIKHTKYGGEIKISSNMSGTVKEFSQSDIAAVGYGYAYRQPDSNGIDTLGTKENQFHIPISKITGSDKFFSFGTGRKDFLCFPQTISVEYYDEGDSEKKVYVKYIDPGLYNDSVSSMEEYLRLVFEEVERNDIQNYQITNSSDNYVLTSRIGVNQIKRNANKRTFVEVTVESESGIKTNQTLTIEPSIKIKNYRVSSSDKRIYFYTELGNGDSVFKDNNCQLYYRNITDGTCGIADSNYITLKASKNYEVYVTRHTEGFEVYSCLGEPLKFKTDGSCNVTPVNSYSVVSMPTSLTSASLKIGTPERNKGAVPVSVELPEGYVIPDGIKLVFLFEYTVTDNLGSSTVYSTVCEQSDIYLRSNYNHKLKAVYAQDASGVYTTKWEPSNIYVNLTDPKYDNEAPYFSATGAYIFEQNDVSKIQISNLTSQNLMEKGSGLETNGDGKGIVHYWLKKVSNYSQYDGITEKDLETLTEYKAFFDLSTGKGFMPINVPEQGIYTIYTRIYDKKGNYMDSGKLKHKAYNDDNLVYFQTSEIKNPDVSTKMYFTTDTWNTTSNSNYSRNSLWSNSLLAFSKTTYSINSSSWSGYTCNLTNISKDLYGYTIQTDSPALIQYMYHCTDLGDDKDSWGTFGCEQYVTQVTSSYSVKQSIIDQIPAGNYYTVLVHYMDGTVQMTPVEYKSK